jgi:hypothetical protein
MKPIRRAENMPPPRASQTELGRGLRAMFDDVAASPLPDRLAELSERLEQALENGELARRSRKG